MDSIEKLKILLEEPSEQIPKMYNILSVEDIDDICAYFGNLTTEGLSYNEFRELLISYKIQYDDDVFENICLKIDLDRDSRIKFNEFISYFITELQNDDNAAERLSLIPPIARPPFIVPTTHRSNVVRIHYTPTSSLSSDGSSSGNYITIGCYSDVNIWSSKWKLERIMHADTIPVTTASTIELSDKRQIKKSPKTLILDAVVMLDLDIICISSVCCDLRFYDISAGKCNLRLYVRNFPSPLNAFHYYCDGDDREDEKNVLSRRLVFGDFVGSIRVIDFARNFKSHFRIGSVIRQISYHELMKGYHETIKFCLECVKLHGDIIRQVQFVKSINSIVSASESNISKNAYLPGIIITHHDNQDSHIVFKMNSGTTCFAFDESSQTLATGGPDCILRLWNPTSTNPKTILSGHTSGIVHIFIQDGSKIYSVDKSKVIKIWDMKEESLQQTYSGLKVIFPIEICVLNTYIEHKREFIIASKKIAVVKCKPRIQTDKSDGETHMYPITLILMNELFHFLVTCGTDSTIIVWDIWHGRKVNWIIRAHTVLRHGELFPIEITAGCFDTRNQFLLTGGTDGSLKVWNFNEGICLRNLHIGCRVTEVFWSHQRIFAIGSTITEFYDSRSYKDESNCEKTWQHYHAGYILCASIRYPDAIVTADTDGDLFFWRYETGQPYMRFNIKHPRKRLQIVYRRSSSREKSELPRAVRDMKANDELNRDRKSRKGSSMNIPLPQCMLSLNNRPLNTSNGTLFLSRTDGKIQVWSHHQNAQHSITDFNGIHVAGDIITAMASDTKNCYLFTGSSLGYIKAWMIVNFCHSSSSYEEVGEFSRIKLHTKFPFLWRDELEGRAKRAVRNQLEPKLLNSYLGHRGKAVTALIYCEGNQILISSSTDKTVRLWNLSGQYINTIGSHIKWKVLSPNEPLPPDYAFHFPADLKPVVSYTTMKVLEGGNIPSLVTKNVNELRMMEKEMAKEKVTEVNETSDARTYRRILRQPVIKKEDKLDKIRYEKPSLDISLPHIPIYRHLRIHQTVPIKLPKNIPTCLNSEKLPDLQTISQLEPEEE